MKRVFDKPDAEYVGKLLLDATMNGEQVFLSPDRVSEIPTKTFKEAGMIAGIDYKVVQIAKVSGRKLLKRFIYTNLAFSFTSSGNK